MAVRGQPTKYNLAVAKEICNRMSEGESLLKIVRDESMPAYRTVMEWVVDKPEFREMYSAARDRQADYYADQCIEIADDGTNDTYEAEDGSKKIAHDHIQRSRLRVDARKWKAAQMAPKKWGQQQVQHTGDGGGPLQIVVNVITKALPAPVIGISAETEEDGDDTSQH